MPLQGNIIANFGKQPSGMFYNGIRIGVAKPSTVKASDNGVVIYVGDLHGYGSTAIIKHANDYTTVYTNLGSVSVKLNEAVKRGAVIGSTPSCSGRADGYVAFELRHKNQAIDPMGKLQKK